MKPNYRRCISCRKVAPKQEFWRIVRLSSAAKASPSIVLDNGMGRSAYLCPQATCLKLAQKKDRLGRALKAAVADQLYHTLWQRLPSDQAMHQPEQMLKQHEGDKSATQKPIQSPATGTG